MTPADTGPAADAPMRRRLFAYNGGLLWPGRVRRILTLAGYDVAFGTPKPGDLVGVWGKSPLAYRGEAMAARHGAALVRIEDAFLRSVQPGRAGEPPLGVMIDPTGVHFDPAQPSALEQLLATADLDDGALLARARDGIARLIAGDLAKYNTHDTGLPPPEPGYVLVVDQARDDASVIHGQADATTFREMLFTAQDEHPRARILVKTHPETIAGHRPGYYGPSDVQGHVELVDKAHSPWRLLEGAIAVYTVSSQLGFEAILMGHRPRVFGQPFYAGWGLSEDQSPHPRRRRKLTRTQLFAAAMILAPTWYDPCRDQLCSFEQALDQLEAQVRTWREDRSGHVALGMRLWKRHHLQQFFGQKKPVVFARDDAAARNLARRTGRRILAWARHAPEDADVLRVEDGFLRSRGLGAQLVPPLSLVTDDLGIYYDPARESRLERLVATPLRPDQDWRAEKLIDRLRREGLSKYNIGGALPELPVGHRILVPGQVDDDASVICGGAGLNNRALLQRVRDENPDAVILFKPHPDVEAGLRPGHLATDEVLGLATAVVTGASPTTLIDQVDEVWTITSLLGFEALIRGKQVSCLGVPFYAGWGLTRDLAQTPERRRARPTLNQLVHAALIAYPRYRDPVSGLPCPVEVVVDRLVNGIAPRGGPGNRMLSKLQGLFASQAWIWR